MRIDKNEAARIAFLAHLEFDDAALQQLASDLSAILDYVDQLPTVEAASLEQSRPFDSTVRDDVVVESADRETLGRNAPDFIDGFFAVPKVFGGES